jgi:hypothetical protein
VGPKRVKSGVKPRNRRNREFGVMGGKKGKTTKVVQKTKKDPLVEKFVNNGMPEKTAKKVAEKIRQRGKK